MRCIVLDPGRFSVPYCHVLCNALSAAGVQVTLVGSRFKYDEEPPKRDYAVDYHFYNVSTSSRLRWMPRSGLKILKGLEHVVDLVRLLIALRGSKCVVHIQWLAIPPIDILWAILMRLSGHGVLLTVHNVLPHGVQGKLARWFYGCVYRCPELLIAHNDWTRAQLEIDFNLASGKIRVIPHPALFYLHDYCSARSRAKVHPIAKSTVLFFGLMRPYKGLDTLIDAVSLLDSEGRVFRCLIVGAADEKEIRRINEKIESLGLSHVIELRFGFLPDRDIPLLANDTAVVAFPYTRIDQSGAAIAMMSLGLAVVASDLPGFRELIEDGETGVIVPLQDPKALAAALARLFDEPELMDALGSAAAAKLKAEHDPRDVAILTIDAYNNLAVNSVH